MWYLLPSCLHNYCQVSTTNEESPNELTEVEGSSTQDHDVIDNMEASQDSHGDEMEIEYFYHGLESSTSLMAFIKLSDLIEFAS